MMCHPGLIDDNHVYRTGLKRHFGSLIRGELDWDDGDAVLVVEALVTKRIDFPSDCSKPKQADLNRLMILGKSRLKHKLRKNNPNESEQHIRPWETTAYINGQALPSFRVVSLGLDRIITPMPLTFLKNTRAVSV
ncbi:hypothetical protein [Microvirga sp. 17 mud 1-3]|uniref:hypothetical protein n=1 Tax=Microvirga sp. 17 mud 1-3 TaxID=2082949 RepID=UPI0013A56933|nr:hypothetical protein [Microvirga sp. 17 mud 1-3]